MLFSSSCASPLNPAFSQASPSQHHRCLYGGGRRWYQQDQEECQLRGQHGLRLYLPRSHPQYVLNLTSISSISLKLVWWRVRSVSFSSTSYRNNYYTDLSESYFDYIIEKTVMIAIPLWHSACNCLPSRLLGSLILTDVFSIFEELRVLFPNLGLHSLNGEWRQRNKSTSEVHSSKTCLAARAHCSLCWERFCSCVRQSCWTCWMKCFRKERSRFSLGWLHL